MELSEGNFPTVKLEPSGKGDCDFSFLEEFSILTNPSSNPRMILLAGIIQREFRSFSGTSRRVVAHVIQNTISLIGDTTAGLAVCLPHTANSDANRTTLVVHLARILSQFALENDAIGDDENLLLSEIYRRIDRALINIPLAEWPELAQIPSGNDHILFNLHYDLCLEPIYDLVAPFWQRAILAQMKSGLLIAPSSMSAFLTPLRQFTRRFPREDLPKNLFHMTLEDREVFAGEIRAFFDKTFFSLSQRTRDDYASTVIISLHIISRSESSKIWTWKYATHVSQLDGDPPEENDNEDGYQYDKYLAAVRNTAESVGDEVTLSLLQEDLLCDKSDGKNEDLVPLESEDGQAPITHQALAQIHHYSAERYAMASFHSPFNQCSLSMHVICTFDHWLSTQRNSKYRLIWPLLFHLLLTTGRSLDWVLSIQVDPTNQATESDAPFYDPQNHSIITNTLLKLKLPQTATVDAVRTVYLPTTHQISIPVSTLAAGWIEKLNGQNNWSKGRTALFIHPDGCPITRSDILELLLQPFSDYLLSRQPGLPAMTLGRIRKAFWNLFTWQGLSPEDATLVSDQYYLDVRAPMFYACRPVRKFWLAYQKAYLAVSRSLFRIYSELFPHTTPLTFSTEANPFLSRPLLNAIHYGACYCPQPEKLHKLVSTIIQKLAAEWPVSDIHKRYDLLSYACAFGISLGLGLRVGESAGLTCRSIDHQAGTIAVNGKSDRFAEEMRILPVPLPLKGPLSQLTVWRNRLGISSEIHSPFFHIFQGRSSAVPLSRERLWRQLRHWENEAGLEEAMFRWHALRHALASYLLQDGSLTFPERSYFLGHVAGQQWLEDLRPGEQQIVFDQFTSIVSRMMVNLGFELTGFSLDS